VVTTRASASRGGRNDRDGATRSRRCGAVRCQHLRALFCFDPRRSAIVLLGGDKSGDWTGWYERNVPVADDLDDEYLAELEAEGLL